MQNKKWFFLFLFCFLAVLFLVYWFRMDWRRKLTSDDGRLTVAHVYSSYKVKVARYYNYIYKVDEDYYSAGTSGSNVIHDGDSLRLQYFLVSYYKSDPKIHTVIWSYKIKTVTPLGLSLDSTKLDKALIRKHTSFWKGVSPTADKNNMTALNSYKNFTAKHLE